MSLLSAAPGVTRLEAYAPARHPAPCDVDLTGSSSGAERYPDSTTLAVMIAERFGVDANRVLVTAGAGSRGPPHATDVRDAA